MIIQYHQIPRPTHQPSATNSSDWTCLATTRCTASDKTIPRCLPSSARSIWKSTQCRSWKTPTSNRPTLPNAMIWRPKWHESLPAWWAANRTAFSSSHCRLPALRCPPLRGCRRRLAGAALSLNRNRETILSCASKTHSERMCRLCTLACRRVIFRKRWVIFLNYKCILFIGTK